MLLLRGYVLKTIKLIASGLKFGRKRDFETVRMCNSTFLDLCPKQNDTGSSLSKKSHVEEFSERAPALFNALTAEDDPQGRWLCIRFPVDFDNLIYGPKKEIKIIMRKLRCEMSEYSNRTCRQKCAIGRKL